MVATTIEKRAFKVDFSAQSNDGLMTSAELVEYLKDKMKVRNCKKLAAKEIEITDNSSNVVISADSTKLTKRDMKLYLKRYLRYKSLKDYVKVSGTGENGFELLYINAVDSE